MDSLHPPPAAPLLPGLRPIQVPLHTQKGLLAVRSFALPWNIQPNFQNEMIYFRSARAAVMAVRPVLRTCSLRRAETRSSFRRFSATRGPHLEIRFLLCDFSVYSASLRLDFLPFFFRQRQHRDAARRRLALWTKIAASSCYNRAPNRRLATAAVFSFASVRAMVPLIFSRLALRVKKIGNRGPAQNNRFLQNVSQCAAQCLRLFPAKLGSQPRWMDPRPP